VASAQPPPKGFEVLQGHLLISRWDSEPVERAIADLCRRIEGRDWPEVAAKLARYGSWEFDDYTNATTNSEGERPE
jgi:hypothetical protein